MWAVIRRLFCKHRRLEFIRKTYGDENNTALDLGGRYVHRCHDCGRLVYRPEAVDGSTD